MFSTTRMNLRCTWPYPLYTVFSYSIQVMYMSHLSWNWTWSYHFRWCRGGKLERSSLQSESDARMDRVCWLTISENLSEISVENEAQRIYLMRLYWMQSSKCETFSRFQSQLSTKCNRLSFRHLYGQFPKLESNLAMKLEHWINNVWLKPCNMCSLSRASITSLQETFTLLGN